LFLKHLPRGAAVANRARVTALASLALLNVFTLGAGLAVAGLLPARLAQWRIPRVAAAPLATPVPVLRPVSGGSLDGPQGAAQPAPGPAPGRLAVTSALTPLLASPVLGRHTGAVVTDLASGATLYASHASSGFAPASTEKLLTAAAALSVLGPQARLATRVVTGSQPGSLVLVGGGDPTLAAGHPPKSDYPQPATLAALASATARWLRGHGQARVRLSYDASLFTGPPLAPGWSTSYITTGNVTPITSLEVDQGRLTASGKPQDADIPTNYRPRSATPAADAAAAFARLLSARGVRVRGQPLPGRAPPGAVTVATVHSPPVAEIVAWMLRESNNVIAEDLARQVALRLHLPASFAGAAAALTRVARRLGVASGAHLVDGSGLSPGDRLTPRDLVTLVRVLAVGPAVLRPAITGLPVAGFSGTLAPGQSVFGGFGRPALGLVRAKTGNLTRAVSLAGIAEDTRGQLLAFAFMADRVPAQQLPAAARVLDAMATRLAGL
jgi:D-alanyl-D-alanine carboxypeptidase/D-alanyl-D-alanine-endopeptidase (penicillin-binding protein 4)